MILQLSCHALRKIIHNFKSVIIAMVGIILSVCVMFSIFVCSNIAKTIILEILIQNTPSISAVTCRIECSEKYQFTMNELVEMDKKNKNVKQIIFNSNTMISGFLGDKKSSVNICGAYGKPLDINMIYGSFLSPEESVYYDCKNIIIDENTAEKIFGNAEYALEKNIVFSDKSGNIHDFWISGVYKKNVSICDDFSVGYISFAKYNDIKQNVDMIYVSKFQAVIKNFSDVDDIRLYFGSVLRKRFHGEEEYKYYVMIPEVTSSVNMLVNLISGILISSALIIFIVSGISIRNVVVSIMKSYRREIGIKKAIGASENVICIEYILQGVFIALAGTFTGFVIMIFIISFLNRNTEFIVEFIGMYCNVEFSGNFDIYFYLSDIQIIITLLFSVLTVILCCFEPIKKSAYMYVVDSIVS